ncbi:DHA1 family bicyclomycin/chloramphenicol resistance-like MFS transporter [Frondihabitans sp. PhB188]|uniref:multidrug effflux MFS transporter n=1 Tax=Frondihabitans sp. PhB188 TaxID=2485200 RepID=UPI000F4980CD|nr:multidrug effflux MFS transporter [Frondihabitans sp. PhB188]ROQ40079.1 DHA1 family bicyclomycin/chloramphenicol resistance-like MFS transporter [Frondihabitans sp. PhB188]
MTATSTDTAARALPTGHRGLTPRLLVVLALLSALAPFGTDLYLSAFPIMTRELDTTATAVQLSLTAFLVGIAVGQLLFGPLSDRVGRFRPLLIGALVCVAASAVAALAPTVGILIAARFVQGLTGAAGMVIGRAIISDLATGKAAAKAFSLMMIVGGVAPVVAPLVGSLLVSSIGWRGILWVVFGIVGASCVAVALVVRESHTPDRRRAARESTAPAGWGALRSREFLGYTLAFAFAFAVMMAYISASPFVYQVMIGLSAPAYGALFGMNAVGLVAMSAVAAKLAATRPERSLVRVGLLLILAAAVAILVLVVTGAPVALLPIPLFVAVTSLGLVLGNATALALGAVPRAAGTGSAVLGALQFGLAALVSPLVGLGGEHTALPLAIVMTSSAVVAVAAFLVVGRRR